MALYFYSTTEKHNANSCLLITFIFDKIDHVKKIELNTCDGQAKIINLPRKRKVSHKPYRKNGKTRPIISKVKLPRPKKPLLTKTHIIYSESPGSPNSKTSPNPENTLWGHIKNKALDKDNKNTNGHSESDSDSSDNESIVDPNNPFSVLC